MSTVVAAGWYADPEQPGVQRYWDGRRWRDAAPGGPVASGPADASRSDRGLLWSGYLVGALVPIVGWGVAIYLAVSERGARIRRHALGVAAVALTAAGIYVAVVLSVAGSHADTNVGSDLQGLLASYGVTATGINCTHVSANLYTCAATVNGQQQYASVTDDGHAIYEQGISTSAPSTIGTAGNTGP